MRVMVTGGNGFVGSHLVRDLLSRGAEVYVVVRDRHKEGGLDRQGVRAQVTLLDGDCCHLPFVERAMVQYKPDYVLHLAAHAIVEDAFLNPAYTLANNYGVALGILEAVRRHPGPRVCVMSTDKVFGEMAGHPYREDDPMRPEGPYEASKAAADLATRAYGRTHGVPVVTLRFCNIYGPADVNLSRIIPKVSRMIVQSGKVRLLRGSPVRREYLYVDDALLAFRKAMEDFDHLSGQTWHVGSGTVRSVPEILMDFHQAGGIFDMEWEERPMPFPEVQDQAIDGARFHQATGYRAERDFVSGLRAVLDWWGARA